MKNLTKLLLSMFAIGILTFGCDEDNNEIEEPFVYPDYQNYLRVGNKAFELSLGVMKNNGELKEAYDGFNTPIWLVSEGVNITNKKSNHFGSVDIKGEGHFIYFELFSAKGNELDNVTYKLDPLSPHKAKTYSIGEYFISKDFDNFNGDYSQSNDLYEGNITVNKEGDEYEITIDFVNKEGIIIEAYYKGKLKYFEDNQDNKASGEGNFKIDNKEYDLVMGAMEGYKDATEDKYHTPIWLSSEGITSYPLEIIEGYFDGVALSGQGDGIAFYLHSENERLDNREYVFSKDRSVGTFHSAAYAIDITIGEKEGNSYTIADGKINVRRWGCIYSIQIDCTNENGEKVTGHYIGPIKYYTLEDEK